MACGFATASSFSVFYRSHYGELPTITRVRPEETSWYVQ
jgi:transcriptional regulator GlxA family with amidase domain